MITPTKDELLAALRLQGSRDFQIILNWFRRSLTEQSVENNNTRDEILMRHMQGRGLEDEEFLNHVITAQASLERMNQESKQGMV